MSYLEDLLSLEEISTCNVGKIESSNQDTFDDYEDLADYITEQAIASTAPFINKWLENIKKQFDSAKDLEEVRDRISEVYEQIDGEGFTTQLMQKRILADLTGRLEVLDEIDENYKH